MTAPAPLQARITGWDRAAIITLGGAGCALSYDALQQMAVAIHVRGLLTYLFPLVIDGFIAYGVRALLVLRAAAFLSRLYVWTLFGTATAASIWANALHAVRLNEEQPVGHGLRLEDLTVGVLSTLAPLALAGAVHLYILIARQVTESAGPGKRGHHEHALDRVPATRLSRTGQQDKPVGEVFGGHPRPELSRSPGRPTDRKPVTPVSTDQDTRTPAGQDTPGKEITPVATAPTSDSEPSDASAQGRQPPARALQVAPSPTARPVTATPEPASDTPDSGDRTTDPVTEQLLPIARKAVNDSGRVTRAVVAQAIRGQGLPLSNQRLTDLMQQLRDTPG
ncbi:DUF2637 domain-containing protein [Streptomyces silvisoli]|uniref:DUF2637 domain-containing protein n=1 Tax=Streptomyces silvisoli TaxID=3034235 RepID=A0ABT5ZPZ6_9ACTN|nr:DUF2637 domain-containing protein [Streptomyces silvisoli]MDF3291905.1 DUF2637 domain-containing protein [Streptomyces silvisoli]